MRTAKKTGVGINSHGENITFSNTVYPTLPLSLWESQKQQEIHLWLNGTNVAWHFKNWQMQGFSDIAKMGRLYFFFLVTAYGFCPTDLIFL